MYGMERYGIENEEHARTQCLNLMEHTHAKHGRLTSVVPGLIVNEHYSCLGASPDGEFSCPQCGRFLLEIKCVSSKRTLHPKTAGLEQQMLIQDDAGRATMNPSHRYFPQVQGQMAITGVRKCFLVLYTNKGIFSCVVDFCPTFWNKAHGKLLDFYMEHFAVKYYEAKIKVSLT